MPEIGQAIAHYRILEKIGQGGISEVYDAKVPVKYSINNVGGM